MIEIEQHIIVYYLYYCYELIIISVRGINYGYCKLDRDS